MKKMSNDSTVSLQQTFWRWLAFSALALMLAAALPARSADVFIDEGDADFAPTPVSSSDAGGKKPASEDVPPASAASDLDSAIGQLEPAAGEGATPSVAEDLSLPGDAPATDVAQPAPVEKTKKTAKASKKKTEVKAAKKASKKKAKVAKKAKKVEKKTAKKNGKKKKAIAQASSKSSKKRKVASVGKFAGGQYATTSRSCAMESSPGAGDSVGMTKAAHKLWVEDAGNTSYWKVYGKSGQAAFVSRDCF